MIKINLDGYHQKEKELAQEHLESFRRIVEDLIEREYSEYRIMDYLNDKGYRTRKGSEWSTAGVHRLLKGLGLKTKHKSKNPNYQR